ncbi:MAG: C25 family cysteine peptidase, partial [Thermoplasmatota archaeon]
MKTILPILVVGILIINGFGAFALNIQPIKNIQLITESINLDIKTLKIKEIDENYLQISFNSEESYLLKPGEPMIPRELKRYELPFGVTNIKIETEPYNIQEIELSKEIRPTPVPLPLTPNKAFINKPSKDKTIYNCNKPYP